MNISSDLATRAVEELILLGYTIEGDLLYPPDQLGKPDVLVSREAPPPPLPLPCSPLTNSGRYINVHEGTDLPPYYIEADDPVDNFTVYTLVAVGEGTSGARFEALMAELEKRFPDPDPTSATLPETRYITAIDAAVRKKQTLPRVDSSEIALRLDETLAEYGWPSNSKNAARAGYELARRILAEGKQTDVGAGAAGVDVPDQERESRGRYMGKERRQVCPYCDGHHPLEWCAYDGWNELSKWRDLGSPEPMPKLYSRFKEMQKRFNDTEPVLRVVADTRNNIVSFDVLRPLTAGEFYVYTAAVALQLPPLGKVYAKMKEINPNWNAYGKSREAAVDLAYNSILRLVNL